MGVSQEEYRAFLEGLTKAELVELVIETRAVADFLRLQSKRPMQSIPPAALSHARSAAGKLGGIHRWLADPRSEKVAEARRLYLGWRNGEALSVEGFRAHLSRNANSPARVSEAAFSRYLAERLELSPDYLRNQFPKWRKEFGLTSVKLSRSVATKRPR